MCIWNAIIRLASLFDLVYLVPNVIAGIVVQQAVSTLGVAGATTLGSFIVVAVACGADLALPIGQGGARLVLKGAHGTAQGVAAGSADGVVPPGALGSVGCSSLADWRGAGGAPDVGRAGALGRDVLPRRTGGAAAGADPVRGGVAWRRLVGARGAGEPVDEGR